MYNFNDIYQYSKDLNILYVEDDKELLEETGELFSDFFKIVTKAINGEDGLGKYNKFKEINNDYYDLIITDINMPKMDGISMIKEIIKINPEQSIIVISAYNDSDKLIDLIHQGVSNFMMKPMGFEELKSILYKTCKILVTQKQRKDYLIQQSKLASMGEMIDFIAHQWLQPIHIIKMQTDLLEMNNESNNLGKNEIDEYIKIQVSQIKHLVETLQEFRKFFQNNGESRIVSYKKLVETTLLLMKSKLKNKIDVIVDIDESTKVEIIENEFKHVLINIINNAIEAFEQNNIKERVLSFELEQLDDVISLNIIDNAGGIPENVIGNIFKPYFTTKEKGTGVGLYLSSIIIEKIGGKLDVKNTSNGAKFSLLLKK
jgi:signal transduction histidine kinase